MDLSHPWRAISPTVTGDVLVVLARAPEPVTGREVARRAGRGASAVARALRELTADGLVRRSAAGAASTHQLNHDHVLAPAVVAMATARSELYRRIEGLVQRWSSAPLNVTVYGSIVTGNADRSSDVDVLVVRPDESGDDEDEWTDQLGSLAEAIQRWTGNPGEVIDFTRSELASADPGFVAAASRGLTVAGSPLRRLAGRRARS